MYTYKLTDKGWGEQHILQDCKDDHALKPIRPRLNFLKSVLAQSIFLFQARETDFNRLITTKLLYYLKIYMAFICWLKVKDHLKVKYCL